VDPCRARLPAYSSSPTSISCRPKRDDGVAAVRTLAERSAGTAGNHRFDALVQASRLNHLTLVEGWTDAAAQETHSAGDAARSFRATLGPMSGALYDERLYTLLK
jgi:quinol monooxygenase YgiN